MGNLLTSLLNSSNALRVYGEAFNIIQNNITNANTPGYVKQDVSLVALPFNPETMLSGGVMAGAMLSARASYLENAVRNQQELLGSAGQRSADLGLVEPLFDLTASFSVPTTINKLFDGFSQLAVSPNDPGARQNVIELAGQVAQSFHQSAVGITRVITNVGSQTRGAVAGINRIAEQLAAINHQYRASSAGSQDAGLDAQRHAALEELSQIANFTVLKSADGGMNVYLGGQTALVIGEHDFAISANSSSTKTLIRDAQGKDITSQVTRGSLGALIQERNVTLPGYLADLNTLAGNFADTVNTALAQGVDRSGSAPAVNLFSYDPGRAAFTLAVTGITPDQIAAAKATAPGGNGNAIAIAQLSSAPAINGFTFSQFYGNLGARVGRDVSTARQESDQYQDAVTQAQQQRLQQSGVSLDEEAAKMLQFRQAYQAAGKMITVLDELTQDLLNLIH